MAQPGTGAAAAAAPAAAPASAPAAATTAAATSPTRKLDFEGLAAHYNELVGALAATIDPVAGKESPLAAAKRLGAIREQFMASCNDLTDELVALQQLVALQPPVAAAKTPAQQQQQQQQQQPPAGVNGKSKPQVDAMDVDSDSKAPELLQQQEQQQLSAQIAQQHNSFLQQLLPAAQQG